MRKEWLSSGPIIKKIKKKMVKELRSNNLANFLHCVLINEVLEFKRKKIAEEKAKDESSKY